MKPKSMLCSGSRLEKPGTTLVIMCRLSYATNIADRFYRKLELLQALSGRISFIRKVIFVGAKGHMKLLALVLLKHLNYSRRLLIPKSVCRIVRGVRQESDGPFWGTLLTLEGRMYY